MQQPLKSADSLARSAAEALGRLSPWGFAGVIAALTVLTRLPLFLTDLINIDEAGWWAGAQIWRRGGVPFVDFVDNKTELIYAIYALPQILGTDSLWAVHALVVLWVSVTAALTGAAAAWLTDAPPDRRQAVARWTTVVYLLLTAAGSARQFLPLNTETAALLPFAAATLLYTRGRVRNARCDFAAAGAFFALAGLFRQTALFVLPLLVGEMIASRVRRGDDKRILIRDGFWFAAGFAAPLTFYLLYHAATRSLPQTYYWLVAANHEIVAHSPPFGFQLTRFAKNILPSLLVGLPAWGLAGTTLKASSEDTRRRTLFQSWAAAAAVFAWTCALGGRWLGHYYLQALQPVVLLAGSTAGTWLVNGGLSTGTAIFQARLAPVLLLTSLLGAFLFSTVGATVTLQQKFEEVSPTLQHAAHLVRSRTDADDDIYVWGFAQSLYYRARRLPASRFIAPNTQMSGYFFGTQSAFMDADPWDLIDPVQWDLFMADLRRRRPALFLDYAENDYHHFGKHKIAKYPELADWLAANYRRLSNDSPIIFYRRIDSAEDALSPEPALR